MTRNELVTFIQAAVKEGLTADSETFERRLDTVLNRYDHAVLTRGAPASEAKPEALPAELAAFAGRRVLVQLGTQYHMARAGGAEPVPFLMKAAPEGFVVADPSDSEGKQVAVDVLVGTVKVQGRVATLVYEDQTQRGRQLEVALHPGVFAYVTGLVDLPRIHLPPS